MFNLGSLSPQLIRELVGERNIGAERFLQFTQWTDVRDVDAREGSLYIFEQPVIGTRGHRSSRVAAGSSTPRRSGAFGTIDYDCTHDYKEQIDLEEGLLKEIQTIDDAMDKIIKTPTLQVLTDFNFDLADVLKQTAPGTNQTLSEKVVTTAWDTSTGTPINDIDDVMRALRGAEVIAVMGLDVAQDLSTNPQITGSDAGSGNEFNDFSVLRAKLRSRGISQIYIDGFSGSVVRDGEPTDTDSQYTGCYDGVFYMGTAGNIIVPRFHDLTFKTYMDDDRDIECFKAKHSHDVRIAHVENGFFFSGIQT